MIPIHVQLRVSTPGLQVTRNPHARTEGVDDRREYVIGSAPDVLLRCQAEGIDPRHCVIVMTAREVWVRDLDSAAGIFVNGERVVGERPLRDADRLRIGPLEVVAEIDDPTLLDEIYQEPSAEREDEEISEWLLHQDETEWELRRKKPELRRFAIPSTPARVEDAVNVEQDTASSEAEPTGTPPPAKPGRLPVTRPPQAPDSVHAAEGALKKLGIRTPDVLRGARRDPRVN